MSSLLKGDWQVHENRLSAKACLDSLIRSETCSKRHLDVVSRDVLASHRDEVKTIMLLYLGERTCSHLFSVLLVAQAAFLLQTFKLTGHIDL